MTEQEIIEKAIRVYGVEHQVIKTIEELSECSAAIARWLYDPQASYSAEEELADVEIMILQMRQILNSKHIDKWKQKKLERLEKRLSENK